MHTVKLESTKAAHAEPHRTHHYYRGSEPFMRLPVALIALALVLLGKGSASATTCDSVAACVFSNNTGSGIAVEGVSQKDVAVYGVSTSNHGVDGRSRTDYGVVGYTYVTLDSVHGYLGRAGVYGIDAGSGGNNFGVLGTSPSGTGVQGQGSVGVSGNGTTFGVVGNGEIGGDFISGGAGGVALEAENVGDPNLAAPLIEGIGSFELGGGLNLHTVFRLDNQGNETILGSLTTNTNIYDVTKTTGGDVVSYATRSASPAIEDIGKGELLNGAASVTFDRTFASAIDTGSAAVFLTPHGNSNGLYTTNTQNGFVVHENNGGHSTLAFDYRIVAVPLDGRSAPRLPAAKHLQSLPLPAARLAAQRAIRPNR